MRPKFMTPISECKRVQREKITTINHLLKGSGYFASWEKVAIWGIGDGPVFEGTFDEAREWIENKKKGR